MFIVFTADDAIQSYTLGAVNQFLAHRKNPNGCRPKMTYFASLGYTNYTLVTDWFIEGNEIADHTYVSPYAIHDTRVLIITCLPPQVCPMSAIQALLRLMAISLR